VLNTNRDVLDKLAASLIEKETLDHNELASLFEKIKKLPERPVWLSSDARPLSNRPPIKIVAKAPVDAGVVDGGVDSEPPSKPKRVTRPRKTPGIATA
jgi:cell division protease FtsH